MKIRILLADDHRILREGIRLMIETQPDMEVVGQADNGLAVLKFAHELKPDVIVMDVNMPLLNGIEASRKITKELPQIKMIALSMYSNKWFIRQILQSGVLGYLLKDCAKEELIQGIRSVHKGQVYLTPSISDSLIKDHINYLKKTDASLFSSLTSRECRTLQLIAEGKTTKDIASILSISTKTVETRRQQIMHKLGIYSVAELTRYAIQEGLIPPNV
jgi:DNA-binding NarL/FixJ family response regulator